MSRLYDDEHFPRLVSQLLRAMGHDVLTVQEAGNANLGIPDEEVLAFAISNDRAIVTINRFDFVRLHRRQPDHTGIIVCSDNPDRNQMAVLINEAISAEETLRGKLIRVNRPSG